MSLWDDLFWNSNQSALSVLGQSLSGINQQVQQELAPKQFSKLHDKVWIITSIGMEDINTLNEMGINYKFTKTEQNFQQEVCAIVFESDEDEALFIMKFTGD